MKALKIASIVVAAIVVVAALLSIVGIPSGFLTSSIAERVERDTGYRLTIAGSTRIGLWRQLHVTLRDVTLENPKDLDQGHRMTVGSLEADVRLGSLWSGHPEVTELVINRPDVRVPLRRERQRDADVRANTTSRPNATPDNDPGIPKIGRITITDGTVTFFNTRDHVENRLEAVSASAVIDADRHLSLDGRAQAGHHPLTLTIKAALPDPSVTRQTIPVELALQAPNLLRAPLSGKAEVRLNGTVVMINGLSGAIGDGGFDGWASVDFASKPLVKLDLDFRRLDVAASAAPQAASPAAAPQTIATSWSNDPIELAGLNYVDAQIRLSAAELNLGSAHFAPVALEASLASGALKATVSNLGAYGGQANATVDIDVSRDAPAYALHSDLTNVRALPLLKSTADFDSLDGKLQARIDVRSVGESQQAIMSNMAGTATANFQDGAIRGLNVAQMIRSLTSGTLSGWQESREQSTDLTQLSASFRIDKGQATTADINLVGPLVKMTGTGTIDLGAKTLALRVEPKLVLTTQGQGRASDPVGFGIPVAIVGPWASPQIYPDVAGILDNPDAAYAKLKQMGSGLFAPSTPGNNPGGGSANTPGGNSLGDTLGNLIQQGLNAARGSNAQPPSPTNPSAPNPNDPSRQPDNQPLNNMLKQFFGR